MDTAKRLRLLIGTVLLALTLALGGCGGSDVKEEQQDVKEEQQDVQEEQQDVEEAEKEAKEDQPVGQPGQDAEPKPGEPGPGEPEPGEPGQDIEPVPER